MSNPEDYPVDPDFPLHLPHETLVTKDQLATCCAMTLERLGKVGRPMPKDKKPMTVNEDGDIEIVVPSTEPGEEGIHLNMPYRRPEKKVQFPINLKAGPNQDVIQIDKDQVREIVRETLQKELGRAGKSELYADNIKLCQDTERLQESVEAYGRGKVVLEERIRSLMDERGGLQVQLDNARTARDDLVEQARDLKAQNAKARPQMVRRSLMQEALDIETDCSGRLREENKDLEARLEQREVEIRVLVKQKDEVLADLKCVEAQIEFADQHAGRTQVDLVDQIQVLKKKLDNARRTLSIIAEDQVLRGPGPGNTIARIQSFARDTLKEIQ